MERGEDSDYVTGDAKTDIRIQRIENGTSRITWRVTGGERYGQFKVLIDDRLMKRP